GQGDVGDVDAAAAGTPPVYGHGVSRRAGAASGRAGGDGYPGVVAGVGPGAARGCGDIDGSGRAGGRNVVVARRRDGVGAAGSFLDRHEAASIVDVLFLQRKLALAP